MAKELHVLVSGEPVGVLTSQRGRVRFVYNSAWSGDENFPLSLSMPLALQEYVGDLVENYLWNLLPDREETINELARNYGVSPRNVLALVEAHGLDLPGAVQIVAEDKIDDAAKREGVKRVSDSALAAFLNRIVAEPSLNRINEDANHFSLAGAQPKKAILRVNGNWYEHKGRTPTTHILKPPMRDIKASVENEYFCLRLAAEIGLRTASAQVVQIGATPIICVERYDRVRFDGSKRLALSQSGGMLFRIHQEDFCQVLGRHPREKYENQGGPSVADIMNALEGSLEPALDRERFMRACVFNFLILGIDAHAKNFSVLIDSDGFRLAPLYDIISAAAYDVRHFSKLAMRVGGEYRWEWIYARHWERLARDCRYPARLLFDHLEEAAAQIAIAAPRILAECHDAGLTNPFLDDLAQAITKRAKSYKRI